MVWSPALQQTINTYGIGGPKKGYAQGMGGSRPNPANVPTYSGRGGGAIAYGPRGFGPNPTWGGAPPSGGGGGGARGGAGIWSNPSMPNPTGMAGLTNSPTFMKKGGPVTGKYTKGTGAVDYAGWKAPLKSRRA